MSEARVGAESPVSHSFFSSREIWPMATGSPSREVSRVAGIGKNLTQRRRGAEKGACRQTAFVFLRPPRLCVSAFKKRTHHILLHSWPSRASSSSASFGPH